MKRILAVILILLLIVTPIFTCGASSIYEGLQPEVEEVTTQQATEMMEWISGNKEAWNKASCIYFIRQMVKQGLVGEDDIRKQFDITYKPLDAVTSNVEDAPHITKEADTLLVEVRGRQNRYLCLELINRLINEGYITQDDVSQEFGLPKPVPPPTPVKPTNDYASLEIVPRHGYSLVKANSHIYSIATEYDDMEESITYVLKKDNKVVYTFDEYWGPRGIVQIDGTIYIATSEAVYKYTDKLTKITKSITGYIMNMVTNGKDIYVACDDDSAGRYDSYYECDYYKVSTSGTVTKLKGKTVPIDYSYDAFSVNEDGDRLSRIPFNDNGTVVRNLSTGKEYFQRDSEEDESHAQDKDGIGAFSNEYAVVAPLYYNNCLLVNVKGSLVYYDSKNKPHVILGNMKGNRLWHDVWKDTPGELWPIKTGLGNKVGLGYITTWTIGDDGYIYGIIKEDSETLYAFKLDIPESVKKTVTYKKAK